MINSTVAEELSIIPLWFFNVIELYIFYAQNAFKLMPKDHDIYYYYYCNEVKVGKGE